MASSADYLPVNGRFRVIETRLPRQADVQRVLSSGGSVDDVRSLLQGSVLEMSSEMEGSVVSQFDVSYADAYQSLLDAVETSAPKSAVTQWIQASSQWVRIRSFAKALIEEVGNDEPSITMEDFESLAADRAEAAMPWFDQVVAVISDVRSALVSAETDEAREAAWLQACGIDLVADRGMIADATMALKADRDREVRMVLGTMLVLMRIRVAVRLSFMSEGSRPTLPDTLEGWFDGSMVSLLSSIADAQTADERHSAVAMALQNASVSVGHSSVLLEALTDAIAFEHAVLFVESEMLKTRAGGMEGALPALAFFKTLERTALMVRVALMTASFGLDSEFMAKRLESVGING